MHSFKIYVSDALKQSCTNLQVLIKGRRYTARKLHIISVRSSGGIPMSEGVGGAMLEYQYPPGATVQHPHTKRRRNQERVIIISRLYQN